MNPIYNHQLPSLLVRHERGLTLVEILVALVISLFLMAGVIQLFVSSKQTYRSHDALSRIQENGRFALEVMARDIRMAGHYGCLPASATITNTLNNSADYLWNFGQAIQGFESPGAENWPPTLDGSIVSPFDGDNVDAITIRGVEGPKMSVLFHDVGNNLRVSAGSDFQVCHILIAASCVAASVFQVTKVESVAGIPEDPGPPVIPAVPAGRALEHEAGSACSTPPTPPPPGNVTDNLGPANYTGGEIARVATKSYYIRTGIDGRPALWRRIGPADSQELIDGVERMVIRYGICTGSGPARAVAPPYRRASTVAAGDWANVCSVRIDLLLASSEDNLVTTPQTVVFPADTGINVTSSDRRLRHGFSTTVGIRNRLP